MKMFKPCICLFMAVAASLLSTSSASNHMNEAKEEPAASTQSSSFDAEISKNPDFIYVRVAVDDVGPVNELDMTVDVDVRLELSWLYDVTLCKDVFRTLPIIRHWRKDDGGRKVHMTPLFFAAYPNLIPQLHLPDVVITEAYSVRSVSDAFQDMEVALTKHGKESAVRCSADYSIRHIATLYCSMDFANYPKDVHECDITVTVNALPDTIVGYMWSKSNSIRVNPHLDLVRFEVAVRKKSPFFKDTVQGGVSGDVGLRIRLERRLGDQAVGTYIPSGLLVVCSWLAFWLSTAERISLCGTLLLALTQQSAAARRLLPPSLALTLVDWWLSGCIGLVLAVIVETAVARFEERILPASCCLQQLAPQMSEAKGHSQPTGRRLPAALLPPRRIDAASCVLFPAVFAVFNICYWATIYEG